MDKAMISGIDSSRGAVETRVPQHEAQHEAQRVVPPNGAEAAETADGSAAPLVNPVVTIDASGLVLVQYRNDGGEVRLQVPSESVVRAYRQRGPDEPEAPSPGSTETQGPAAADQAAPAPAPTPPAVTPPMAAAQAAAPTPPPARSAGVSVDV